MCAKRTHVRLVYTHRYRHTHTNTHTHAHTHTHTHTHTHGAALVRAPSRAALSVSLSLCLSMPHGRCRRYGAKIMALWHKRLEHATKGVGRVRRVWMRGQGQKRVSMGECRNGDREGREMSVCQNVRVSTCAWQSRALSLIAHCPKPI